MRDTGTAARTIPARAPLGMAVALLALPQPLAWAFLGFAPWMIASGVVGTAAIGLAAARAMPGGARIEARTVALLALFSLGLFLLGGEGHLFYANTDWQVRDAVLRDLVADPWPFAYAMAGGPTVLRAPLAMYLAPALVGKIAGYRAAEFATLAQNAAMLTCLLAVGATLFEGRRSRAIALSVTTLFSGMDAIGNLLTRGTLAGHLEWWAHDAQFSAHVTQAFWVPQHALAGWAGALGYMLWRAGRLRPGAALAIVPLAAFWSPLAAIGLLPFAAHAGIVAIARRRLTIADVALPGAASLLTVPTILYMAAGSGAVGGGGAPIAWPTYMLFEALEAAPFLAAAAAIGARTRFGGVTLAIVAAFLLAAPYVRIGHYIDFSMRASIPALAILSVIVADVLIAPRDAHERPAWRALLIGVLAIGATTPLSEVVRALVLPPSPAPGCGYLGVVPGGDPTYVAPLATVPRAVRPRRPATIPVHEPRRCWDRPWPMADQNGLR